MLLFSSILRIIKVIAGSKIKLFFGNYRSFKRIILLLWFIGNIWFSLKRVYDFAFFSWDGRSWVHWTLLLTFHIFLIFIKEWIRYFWIVTSEFSASLWIFSLKWVLKCFLTTIEWVLSKFKFCSKRITFAFIIFIEWIWYLWFTWVLWFIQLINCLW